MISLPIAPPSLGDGFGVARVQEATGTMFLHNGTDCIMVLSCHLDQLAEAVRIAQAFRDAD